MGSARGAAVSHRMTDNSSLISIHCCMRTDCAIATAVRERQPCNDVGMQRKAGEVSRPCGALCLMKRPLGDSWRRPPRRDTFRALCSGRWPTHHRGLDLREGVDGLEVHCQRHPTGQDRADQHQHRQQHHRLPEASRPDFEVRQVQEEPAVICPHLRSTTAVTSSSDERALDFVGALHPKARPNEVAGG